MNSFHNRVRRCPNHRHHLPPLFWAIFLCCATTTRFLIDVAAINENRRFIFSFSPNKTNHNNIIAQYHRSGSNGVTSRLQCSRRGSNYGVVGDENDNDGYDGWGCRSLNRLWKTRQRQRQRRNVVMDGSSSTTPRINNNGQHKLFQNAASSVLLLRGGGGLKEDNIIENTNDDNTNGIIRSATVEESREKETTESSSASSISTRRAGSDLCTKRKKSKTMKATVEATATATTTTTHLNQQYALKRGTRTTGAGASKRRNPSIFSINKAKSTTTVSSSSLQNDKASTSSSSASGRWTAAALGPSALITKGDVATNNESKNKPRTSTKAKQPNNPMVGRLWAKRSERGTLLLKFPRQEEEDDESEPLYVEVSEAENDAPSSSAGVATTSPTVHARYVDGNERVESTTSSSSSSSSHFVPIEGIYGVYDLPCAGPHAVLITESEEVYTSPPQPSSTPSTATSTQNNSNHGRKKENANSAKKSQNDNPLLELRRIKSMEIVPLRNDINKIKSKHQSIRNENDDEQLEEEARQLRLLRNSFKEHDFYFTVPPSPRRRSSSRVIRDVTHSLQRSFLQWAATSSSRRRGDKTDERSNDEVQDGRGADKHAWWMPYMTERKSTTDGRRKKRRRSRRSQQRMVDPRFFWNEQAALTLLPPDDTNIINGENNNGEEEAHALLLDHVVPVTSAFVGVRRDVPIPSAASSSDVSAPKEKYDQILISRRSRYRTGTRFTRRGADDTGAVANYAETEQICFVLRSSSGDNNNNDRGGDEGGDSNGDSLLEVYSHVQTRGSIPLHWSSPASVKEYRPRVYIGVDPAVQARGLRDHLLGELWWYSSSSSSSSDEVAAGGDKRRAASEVDKVAAKIAMVNLIDKHGDQGRLGRAFDSVLSAVLEVYGEDGNRKRTSIRKQKDKEEELTQQLNHPYLGPGSVQHIWYDFHAECKGGRWDRLGNLLEQTMPALDEQGYFCAVPSTDLNTGGDNEDDSWGIRRIQDGVVRTNCMDCLDRTNVVQSMFARYVLHRQLHERPGLSPSSSKAKNSRSGGRRRTLPLEYVVGFKQHPLTLPWTEGEAAHRHLWADNADAISRLYAGTPALKGDFTRTGKRTKRGALDDGMNSLQRYYLNNFIDADRQEGMDLLVGSADFHALPTSGGGEDDGVGDGDGDETISSARVSILRELAKSSRKRRRRGFDETHARIKVESGGDFLLRATSSAANNGGDDNEGFPLPLDVDTQVALSSITHRASSSTGRPWWVTSVNEEEDHDDDDSYLQHARNAFGFAKKRAVATSLILLTKAPILSAAIITVMIASGFSSQLDWDSD